MRKTAVSVSLAATIALFGLPSGQSGAATADFVLDAASEAALLGAARNLAIGHAGPGNVRPARYRLERGGPVGTSRTLLRPRWPRASPWPRSSGTWR